MHPSRENPEEKLTQSVTFTILSLRDKSTVNPTLRSYAFAVILPFEKSKVRI
jgi:hypothetical protein